MSGYFRLVQVMSGYIRLPLDRLG